MHVLMLHHNKAADDVIIDDSNQATDNSFIFILGDDIALLKWNAIGSQ